MKTLKQIRELYKPQTKDGQKFVDKHVVKKTPDANKNDDKLFNASNIKSVNRQPDHGYNPGQDEKVYEEAELEEGDVIQFPKRNKSNDEEEKRNEEDRKIPGWMLRHPDAKPLLKKLKDIQDRKERERKFREDEAKEFGESTRIYEAAKKSNRNPDHIKSVESSGRGKVTLTTHGGETHEISAKDTGGQMPKPGEHISKYIRVEEVELGEKVHGAKLAAALSKITKNQQNFQKLKDRPVTDDDVRQINYYRATGSKSKQHPLDATGLGKKKFPWWVEQKNESEETNQLDEVAPKGWKKTVERMKKHKEIDNPFALAYWMKKKGYKSRFKESVDSDISEAGMNQKDLDQMIQNVKNKSLPPSAKSNPTTKLDRMIQNVDKAYKASKQQKRSGVLKVEDHTDEGQQLDEIGFNAGEVWKSQMSTPKAAAPKASKPVSNPFARNSGMGYASKPQTMSSASPSANRSLRQQQLRSYSAATQKPAPITSAPASATVLPKVKTTGYTQPVKQKATPLSPPAIASAAPAPKMEKPVPLAAPRKASTGSSMQKTAGTVAAAKPKPKTSDANLVPGKRGDTFKTGSQMHRTTGPGNVPGRKTGTFNFKSTTNTPPKTPGYFEKQGAPIGGSQRAIAQAQKDAATQAYQAAQDTAAERRSKIFAKFKNAFTIKQPSRMGESKIEDINELDDAAGGYPVVTDSSKIKKPKPEPKIASATPPLNPMVKKPRIHSSYPPGKKPIHHIVLPNEKKI